MNSNIPSLLSIMIPSLGFAAAIDYPQARKADVVDELHGTRVPDPYRWLEDDNSPETKEWVAAQNRVTEDYLATIPQRGEIRKRLAELWNFERAGAPREYGGRWFFTHNSGLQNQSVLRVADTMNGNSWIRTSYRRTAPSRSLNSNRAKTGSCSPIQSPAAAATGMKSSCATWPAGKTPGIT